MACLVYASASCSFTNASSPSDLDPDSSHHMKTKQQIFNEKKSLGIPNNFVATVDCRVLTDRVQLVFYCSFAVKSLNFIAWKL